MVKIGPKSLATSVIDKKSTQSKQSPNRRKFAHSGHPRPSGHSGHFVAILKWNFCPEKFCIQNLILKKGCTVKRSDKICTYMWHDTLQAVHFLLLSEKEHSRR
jgi:hypothetical protein